MDLIDTLWNVKTSMDGVVDAVYDDLIDTLWNVKLKTTNLTQDVAEI